MKKRASYSVLSPALILRLGLAFVFLYAAVSSLQHPLVWVGFVPVWLAKIVSATVVLKIMAVAQIGLGIWLLAGKWLRYAALGAALMLAGILFTNLSGLLTTFRDVGLLCMAVALFLLES